MKFILLFGPPAVGKMTVGHELEKITELKLFHNHMTIEMILPFFDYGSLSFKKLSKAFRRQVFEEVAKSDLEGMIFTYVWAFDLKSDEEFVNNTVDIFKKEGATIYYVELETTLEERLERNKTVHRLEHKPSKRNLESSEEELLKTEKEYVLSSQENKFDRENYIKINNTNLSAEETAKMIKIKFNL